MNNYPSVSKILAETEPEHKKKALQQWIQRVGEEEANRIKVKAMERGKILDSYVYNYYKTGDVQNKTLNNYFGQYKFLAIEKSLVSHEYKFNGRIDSILEKDGLTILTDWKTSNKPKIKKYLEDYEIQLGAYFILLKESGQDINKGLLSVFSHKIQEFFYSDKELCRFEKLFIDRVNLYYQKV